MQWNLGMPLFLWITTITFFIFLKYTIFFFLKQKYNKYNALSIMHYFSVDKVIHTFYFFSVLLQNYMYFIYKYNIFFYCMW